ncbi:Sec-independent protein translocase protein TatB [Paraburkholderia fungorum]|uniref:Sec-independent protein translocase protein TatB n=1 Tax=Paraburkholderia fungorum TaxID=134537 RepID=UPI0038B885B3
MLDLGLTKMAVIGVVALVVLGPERLPHVARTAGALLGRAQRYISDVKDEVTREIELSELQNVKSEFVAAAANIENVIHENLREQEADLKLAWNGGSTASPDAEQAAAQLPLQAPDVVSRRGGVATGPKRRNWRGKQAATPTWYKRTAARRRHVQSTAARVARQPSTYPAGRQGFFNV